MNSVIILCPHCRGRMLVDPRYLTLDTNCPYCFGVLMPCENVAPPPPPPLPVRRGEMDFEDTDRPRRRREREPAAQPISAFGAGFNGCLGVGCAIVFVFVGIPAIIIALGGMLGK